MDDDVGNVAVNEDLTGKQSNDLVGWNPAVGAAYPKKLWRLLFDESCEKAGIACFRLRSPGAVLLK
jgi:hypothetical protein